MMWVAGMRGFVREKDVGNPSKAGQKRRGIGSGRRLRWARLPGERGAQTRLLLAVLIDLSLLLVERGLLARDLLA